MHVQQKRMTSAGLADQDIASPSCNEPPSTGRAPEEVRACWHYRTTSTLRKEHDAKRDPVRRDGNQAMTAIAPRRSPLAAQSTGAESSGSIIPNVLIHLSLYSAGVPAPQIWVVVPKLGQSADVACRAWLSLMHVISLELDWACACQSSRVAGTKTRTASPGEAEAKALRRHHPDPNPRT